MITNVNCGLQSMFATSFMTKKKNNFTRTREDKVDMGPKY